MSLCDIISDSDIRSFLFYLAYGESSDVGEIFDMRAAARDSEVAEYNDAPGFSCGDVIGNKTNH